MATKKFIAVQCFQCSTMQVKQQKKSSNKWTCVVCNEKQSVCKVFFNALMAKEVRDFVQNFNMSRMLSDQKDLQQVGEESSYSDEIRGKRKKRTDWTEYIDDEERMDRCGDSEGNGGVDLEPVIVTELPEKPPTFKKQKLRENSSNNTKLPNPHITNRDHRNRHYKVRGSDSSKQDEEHAPSPIRIKMSSTNVAQSKWSCYISREEDDTGDESEAHFVQQTAETVEDDIHPDFL